MKKCTKINALKAFFQFGEIGGFAKKFLWSGGMILIDVRVVGKTQIYQEFDEVENSYWFDFKKSKFLHNIDTFYYSVKFDQLNQK